ncbi:MAG: DNA-directed RNA polymerase subunit beta, partial [Planctomycetaceae bacterium]
MATRAVRRLQPTEIRRFGSGRASHSIPDLTEIQTRFYDRFLQYGVASSKRKDEGIEGVLREIFPIESYDKTVKLEYVRYELGKPRYDPDECRQLRLTYGRPLRVWLRLTREQPVEEEVYLGDIPILLGGGEFIINGAERVVVSQLHRSPGIDFVTDTESTDRKTHNCRIIPERGSWIEFNVSKKDTLQVRIDQSGKFSALTLLRAMDPKYSRDAELVKLFQKTWVEKVSGGRSVVKLEGRVAADDIVYPRGADRAGEIIVEAGCKISKDQAELIATSGLTAVELTDDQKIPLIVNSLREDADESKRRTGVSPSHEDALIRIYQRLRPGNPPALDKAKALFDEKFKDTNRYRLGRVGRFRINRKLGLSVPETEMTLRPEDLIAAIRYMLRLSDGENEVEVDDIDHL